MEIRVSRNLRYLRSIRNLTFTELGKEIGIKGNTLSSYERGDVLPPIPAIIKLCNFFNVLMDDLVLGDVTQSKESNEKPEEENKKYQEELELYKQAILDYQKMIKKYEKD